MLLLAITVCGQDPEQAFASSVQLLNQVSSDEAQVTWSDLETLQNNLVELYTLCRQDAVCASRFFMSSSATIETKGNDAARRLQASTEQLEQTKFKRLVVLWQVDDECPMRENALRERIYLNDYDQQDAAWWLTMMRTAKFCGDNQLWLTGHGCVTRRDRLNADGSEVNPESSSASLANPWATAAIAVFGLIVIAVIVYVLFEVQKQFGLQKEYIRAVSGMWDGKSPRDVLGTKLMGASVDDSAPTDEIPHVMMHVK